MPKVVTSEGQQAFLDSGKPTETFERDKPVNKAADLAAKLAATDAPTIDTPPPTAPPADDAGDTGLEPDDAGLGERAAKRIAKKHREMREAQETAAEAERFAENQFNEARAERLRADKLAQQLAALEGAKPVESPPAAVAPVLKAPVEADFYKEIDGQRVFQADEYIKAVTKHAADTARAELKAELAADEAKRTDEASKAAAQAERVAIAAKFDAFKAKTPDFDAVVKASSGQLPTPVMEYLVASEHGPELYYHYARNPDEAAKVMESFNAELKRTPGDSGLRRAAMKAVAVIARVEASFDKPAVANAVVSNGANSRGAPPPPITPLPNQGTTTVNTDPSKMTYKELRAYERARAQRRH